MHDVNGIETGTGRRVPVDPARHSPTAADLRGTTAPAPDVHGHLS
jgi:hypothetical protein